MASFLLLYYHLSLQGGFANGEINNVDIDEFNIFEMLTVEVAEECSSYIDGFFLREAAAMYLLCALNEMTESYPDDFLSHDLTKTIIGEFEKGHFAAVPEVAQIFALFTQDEKSIDFDTYQEVLVEIFELYVLRRFTALSLSAEEREAIENGGEPPME